MTAEREQSQGESLKSSLARLCPLPAGAPEGEASSVHAKDVGEAKERIALLLEIMKAEDEQKNGKQPEDPDSRTTIRKALPFEVDCIVPRVFSELYYEEVRR